MDECSNCKGIGTRDGCPLCGVKLNQVISIVTKEELLDVPFEVIPECYRGIIWQPSILEQDLRRRGDFEYTEKYVKRLDNIFKNISKGLDLPSNVLICSSPGMGKTMLSYALLGVLFKKGKDIVPLFDNQEYRTLCRLQADILSYKNYIKEVSLPYSLNSIINADIAIMRIDSLNVVDSFRDIISLIDKRSKQGKKTIILSYYTINQITSLDMNNFLKSYLSMDISNPKALRLINYYME